MCKRIIYILILQLFITTPFIAQDVVFTNLGSNPLYTSGALTGSFNGKYRVGTGIRKQWIGISKDALYNTKSIFADMKINTVKNDFFSFGILLMDDISGSKRIKLGIASGLLSMSYSKHLYNNKYTGQNQYLTFGFQVGYGKRYFDGGSYLFGVQFDKSKQQVDPDTPTGESLLNSRLYPDINTGLMYYISGKYSSFYLGANIKHINKPNISLLKDNISDIYQLYTGIVGGEFSINRNISLLPSTILNVQESFLNIIIGSSLRYQYISKENNAFRIGVWARLPNSITGIFLESISFSTGFEFNQFELNINYDITVSELNNTIGHRGAFELSLAYVWGDIPKNTPINCPKF